MNWTESLRNLNFELAEYYPTTLDITRLAKQANIRTVFMQWQNQSVNDWFSIIELADGQKKLKDLLNGIKQDGLVTGMVDIALAELDQPTPQPKSTPPPSGYGNKTLAVECDTDSVIKQTKNLINADMIDDALQLLRGYVTPIDSDLENTLILISSRYAGLKRDIQQGTLTREETKVEKAQIKASLLYYTEEIPGTIELLDWKPSPTTVKSHIEISEGRLEKIMNGKNEMLKTIWVTKAAFAMRSVCRVLIDGHAEGTGFLLKGGYLMTNHHVLNSADTIRKATIEFNYEEGQTRTVEYRLNPNDFKTSPETALDYTWVRVIDNPNEPLQQWGYLEVEKKKGIRVKDAVNIIQHPWGEVKRLSSRDNLVSHIFGNKLFYLADTDEGSSGSPVFNDDWKVVALHSRGSNDPTDPLVVDVAGNTALANQGFLISAIDADLGYTLSSDV